MTYTKLNEQQIPQSELASVGQQATAGVPDSQSTIQDFLSGKDNPETPAFSNITEDKTPDREPIKHLLVGSPKAVRATIYTLQVLGYADVRAWSPLVPTANPGEVMTLMSRSISVQ
jgi:hypothetical protein